jgi:hypothetical protein
MEIAIVERSFVKICYSVEIPANTKKHDVSVFWYEEHRFTNGLHGTA